MVSKLGLGNPYIAGRALSEPHKFFGREDLLQLAETKLRVPEQTVLLFAGQRRIGKTSILLQLLCRLPSPPFLPIYFDLMDQAHGSLGTLLFNIASAMASEVKILPARRDVFDDQGDYFHETFLPTFFAQLEEGQIPILLLDEFDVFDTASREQLPLTTAGRALFPFLRKVLQKEPRLKFVIVVGRRAEDLSPDFKATFKTGLHYRVSMLDDLSARNLITVAERQGTILFSTRAVDRILALTSGHPYLIQLICQILWDNARDSNLIDVPQVDLEDVERASLIALEAGHVVFEWIWEGLSSAERVIASAIAQAPSHQHPLTKDQIMAILQQEGVRFLTRDLETAPDALVELNMLQKRDDNGYYFFVDLIGQWIKRQKPLFRIKKEIDRLDPLAESLFRASEGYYRQRKLNNSRQRLREALGINPNHVKARLLLSQIFIEEGSYDLAVKELKEVQRYDEREAHYPLIRTLLLYGEELQRERKDIQAIAIYEQLLELSSRETTAQQRIDEIKSRRKQELDASMRELNNYQVQEDWANALRICVLLANEYPEDDTVQRRMNSIRIQQNLNYLYDNAKQAINEGVYESALRYLQEIDNIQPKYKDTIELRTAVIRLQDKFERDEMIKRAAVVVESSEIALNQPRYRKDKPSLVKFTVFPIIISLTILYLSEGAPEFSNISASLFIIIILSFVFSFFLR